MRKTHQRPSLMVAAAFLPVAGAALAVAVAGMAPLPLFGLLGAGVLASSALAWRVASELARCRAEASAAGLALHHSTDVLRSMVSALPVGVIAVDREGRVELWNPAAETILGYTAEEMVGRPALGQVFLPVADRGTVAADVLLRMVTGQLIRSEEVPCRRKDGSHVETLFSGAPLFAGEDRLRGAICVFEDVTQRKTLATQLQQAQKMEAVGQLTGGLAHDFNNILGVAVGNLDLLAMEIEDRPQASELAEIALKALLRGAELTRALLAFSRRQPLQPARVDAAELLMSATRMLSRTLGEQVRVACHTEGDLWPVLVDAAQLEAAITNLAINSRDAMPGGGSLSVVARNVVLDDDYATQTPEVVPGDYLLVEVTDTGSGMSPDLVARVFEPFFTTKPVGQGTGLGLSMVYGFIKQSGGHIKIYSEVGHGTTVRLYLPRAPQDGQAAVTTEEAEPIRGGTETVLVVEDNADVRRTVEMQLGKLGYRVIPSAHGPAALAVLEAGTPVDLLFTDVVMPEGMSGFELAAAARRLRPDLKVLFTSGFPGAAVPRPAGCEEPDLLSKPYRRQELARALRNMLDRGTPP